MIVWLALQLAPGTGPPPWYGGRVYTSEAVHVGVRPAFLITPGELAVGVTCQVRVRLP